MKYALSFLALAAPAALLAQAAPAPAPLPNNGVTIMSETFVAKTVTDERGQKKNQLFPATRVLPGDPLLFQLTYENKGKAPVTRFVINNAVPKGVDYTGVREAWAQVTIDGAKTFGALTAMKVKKPDGTFRPAIPQDVTGIRWTLAQPIAPGGKGVVQFYAVVK